MFKPSGLLMHSPGLHSRRVLLVYGRYDRSQRRYSALFANKINGMAHCRIITDEDVDAVK
jgi:hypothetical protein